MSPEGTRSPTGGLLEGRPGAAYLAAKSGLPVVPVAEYGGEDAKVIERLRRFRRMEIHIQVGEPFILPPLPARNREAVLQEYTDEIMCRIAALLPPAYHGVYADHPRLKELLGEDESMSPMMKTTAGSGTIPLDR
jgi:1-acyl-sn-glycerol-3-phosphate acyltransferase